MRRGLLLLLALALLAAWAGAAPQVVYTGRVSIAGAPFTGTGQFKFALLDRAGRCLWASGVLSDPAGMPAGTVRLPVVDGVYTVTLGDARLGMPPVTPELLARPDPPALRIWFDDGTHGMARLGADQPLALPRAEPDVQAILLELRQIRQLLEKMTPEPRGTPAATVTPSPAADAALGRADAPLTLVEFTDFQCGFCARFAETIFPEIRRRYVETGQLRVVSRNLPLAFHANAPAAARAAIAAGLQGQYWPMHEMLFAHQTALGPDDLLGYARALGLDVERFAADLNSPATQARLEADLAAAAAAGIRATPTFVLGRTADGGVLDGERIDGAQPFAVFDAAIRRRLEQCTQGKSCGG